MQGIGVSPGISIGKAYVLHQRKEVASGILLPDEAAVLREVGRYREAVKRSVEEIQDLFARAPEEEKDILEVQLELLQDLQMETDVLKKIEDDKMTARDAVLLVTELAVLVFEQMEDEYLKARGADVQDAGYRIIKNLSGAGNLSGAAEAGPGMGKGLIIIAGDLSPSGTVGRERSKVHGFATQSGGRTSHVAIVARLRGLLAVVGCWEGLAGRGDGGPVVLDGGGGEGVGEPTGRVVGGKGGERGTFIVRGVR